MFNAEEYYRRIVKPTVEEFYQNNHDIRLAMLASMAVMHTPDYIYQNKMNDVRAAETERRNFIGRKNIPNTFQMVCDFGNASKHCRLVKEPNLHSKNYRVNTPAIAGLARAGATRCGDRTGGIVVEWCNRGEFNLVHSLKGSLEFLEAEFPQLKNLTQ